MSFCASNEWAVLRDKGRTTKSQADSRAATEYEEFAARRRAFEEAEAEAALTQPAFEKVVKELPERPKRKPL
jgi:hypothetical protein